MIPRISIFRRKPRYEPQGTNAGWCWVCRLALPHLIPAQCQQDRSKDQT